MSLVQNLCALTLRQVVKAASQAAGLDGEAVLSALDQHFTDHSGRLACALQSANDRAWQALEVALAGESFWDRVATACARAEDRAFRRHVRAFLDAAPLPEEAGKDEFRRDCLRELRAARKAGLLSAGRLDVGGLARQAAIQARFADPQQLLDADGEAIAEMAVELHRAGHAQLSRLLTLKPPGGEALLVAAARYFFRREVETDAELFRGLAWAKMDASGAAQEAAFAALGEALADHAGRLVEMLDGLHAAAESMQAGVLDLQQEQLRQGGLLGDLYEKVVEQHRRFDLLARDLRPADSLSLRTDAERRLVKALVARFRSLPPEKRRETPALLNALGKLQVLSGDFEDAQKDFGEVAAAVAEPAARAEAHFNAYRAALGRRDWDGAMRELVEAVKLDGKRFAPFPVGKYHPKRILGAGGFGVAFLCRHKELGADVVVKALYREDLDRGVDEALAEARLLHRLDHPAVVRLLDCGYTLPAAKARPYFVMQHFAGETLEEFVRRRPLTAAECVAVARRMAEGLHVAHTQGGVLHRDVKPANVLVRKDALGVWQVKLIDFGLALRAEALAETLAASTTRRREAGGAAGTPDYAAPEQLGRLPGVAVGPHSDVYGLGKTCCFALFRTTQPLPKHWASIPEPLARLLGDCLEENPRERPADCAEFLARLAGIQAAAGVECEIVTDAGGAEAAGPGRASQASGRLGDRGRRREPAQGACVKDELQRLRLLERMKHLHTCYLAAAGAARQGWTVCFGIFLGVAASVIALLGVNGALAIGDKQNFDDLQRKYHLGDYSEPRSVPYEPSETWVQRWKKADQDDNSRQQACDEEFNRSFHPFQVHLAASLPTAVLCLVSPLALLLWRKSRKRLAAASALNDALQVICREYPEQVRAWGGKAALDNAAAVKELISILSSP